MYDALWHIITYYITLVIGVPDARRGMRPAGPELRGAEVAAVLPASRAGLCAKLFVYVGGGFIGEKTRGKSNYEQTYDYLIGEKTIDSSTNQGCFSPIKLPHLLTVTRLASWLRPSDKQLVPNVPRSHVTKRWKVTSHGQTNMHA